MFIVSERADKMNTTKVFALWSFKNRVAIEFEPGFSLNSPIFDPSTKFCDIDRSCHPSLPMYIQCTRPAANKSGNFCLQVQMMMSLNIHSAIDEYHIYVLDDTCGLLHSFVDENDVYEFDEERQSRDFRILVELNVTITSQSTDTYVSSHPIWLECRSKFVCNSDAHLNFILYPSVPNGGPLIKRCQINGLATDWTLSILSNESHHRKMELTWCRPRKDFTIIFQFQEHATKRHELRFLIFDHHQKDHELNIPFKLKNLLISSLGFVESTAFVPMNPNLEHKLRNYVIAIAMADRESATPSYGSTFSLASAAPSTSSMKNKRPATMMKSQLSSKKNDKENAGFWATPSVPNDGNNTNNHKEQSAPNIIINQTMNQVVVAKVNPISNEQQQQLPPPPIRKVVTTTMPPMPSSTRVSVPTSAATPLPHYNPSLPPPPPIETDQAEHFLRDMFLAQKFCDVTLKVGQQQIRVHRIVMASRSTLFRRLLSTNESATTFEIDDLDFNTVAAMVGFIYMGRLNCGDGRIEYDRLLAAAERYGVSTLKHRCELDLIAQLSVANVSTMLGLAHRHHASILMNGSIGFVRRNVGVVKEMDEFKSIFIQFPDLGFELFRQCV